MDPRITLPPPWDLLTLDDDQKVAREFGPLSLSFMHRGGEWFIERFWEEEPIHPSSHLPRQSEKLVRYVTGDEDDASLTFIPRLADRPIVARPELPLLVVPGSQIRLGISTPLRVGLLTGSGSELGEIPTLVLKDTWFGANTRVGEVCYAARTAATLDLDSLRKTATRAITVVHIRNDTSSALRISRIKIPLPHLDLYVDRSGSFFTPAIRVTHTNAVATDSEVLSLLPTEAAGAVRVSAARSPLERGLFRPFGKVLA